MPLPAPALSPAASSTVSTARETYIRRLWAWIAARRPAGLHLEGEALISFSIGPRGDLRGLSLDRSSGNAQLDRLALRTVRLAAPFPRPPERDRKSVVWGKSVSVRVDLGGRRRIKKKTQITREK